MRHEPLSQRARGRWRGILPALGISESHLTGKHGPCPICRGGRDRWRFDDKDGSGSWICSKCGAGDGVKLVMEAKGVEFKEAARMIEEHVGTAVVQPPRQERSERDKKDAMNALWKRSRPITLDDPAGRYLHARAGITEFPPCLRLAPDERYSGPPASFHPALVAMVTDAGGKPTILHRTYLTDDGRKARLDDPRRMMPGTVPPGSAVRLMEFSDILGIAEGIETAFSASILFDVPCWAALTAGLLQSWSPPEGVKHVMVFGDNDMSYTGQAAAHSLAARLVAKGMSATVEIPIIPGRDWNDMHREKRSGEAA